MSLKSIFANYNQVNSCPRIKLTTLQKSLIIIAIVVGSFAVIRNALAQETTTATEPSVIETVQDSKVAGGNLETWLDKSMGGNVVNAINGLAGEIPKDVLQGKVDLKKKGKGSYVPGGVMGLTTNMIASLYAPAGGTSGVQYIAQSFGDFLGKPAYAQGIGFAGLQPILPIWRGFRNMTYLASSIIFILIGIMIMMRVKISPQAVITIQNAIPQIVTTLILITFSYAIAGLVIDGMQFIQSAALAILFNTQGKALSANLFDFSIHNYSFGGLSTADMNTVAGLTQRAIPMAPFVVWGMVLGGIIGSLPFFGGPGVGTAIGAGLAIPILLLVLIICMLVWMFQFYFGCLKCYITAIFKIIIAPLEIAAGAFPNSKMGFNSWIWDLIANLAVFPISILFLVLGNLIIDAVSWTGTSMWTPDIIGGASLQSGVLGTISLTSIVSVGIGLSVIALMSKLPEMVPQFIFMIKPSPWQVAIGQSYDFSKNGAYNFSKAMGKQQIVGPTVKQFGTDLGKNSTPVTQWINKNVRVGPTRQPIGNIVGNAVEQIGTKIGEGKL